VAQPYDTINAIGNGPREWWRYNEASGNIPNEGNSAEARALQPVQSFNGTYQVETGPDGDGFGLEFNGVGFLQSVGPINNVNAYASRGTVMHVLRHKGVPNKDDYHLVFSTGVDQSELYLSAHRDGIILEFKQTPFTNGEATFTDNSFFGMDFRDELAHSMTYVVGPDASTEGILYGDGLGEVTIVNPDHVPDIPDNWWLNSMPGAFFNAGRRGTGSGLALDNIVIYETLVWDEVLTQAQVIEAHNALVLGIFPPGSGGGDEDEGSQGKGSRRRRLQRRRQANLRKNTIGRKMSSQLGFSTPGEAVSPLEGDIVPLDEVSALKGAGDPLSDALDNL